VQFCYRTIFHKRFYATLIEANMGLIDCEFEDETDTGRYSDTASFNNRADMVGRKNRPLRVIQWKNP